MDVRLPDGTVIRGVPDGMSKADLTAKLASNGYDTSKLGGAPVSGPDAIPTPRGLRSSAPIEPAQPSSGSFETIGGIIEPVLSTLSGLAGGVVGSIAGAGKSLIGGKFGTQEGIQQGEQLGGKVAEALTYQPRSETGQQRIQAFGQALQNSGIIGIPIPELNTLGRGVGSANVSLRGLAGPGAEALAAQDAAAAAGAGRLRDLVRAPQQSVMSGVGAAATGEALLRQQRAASLGLAPLTEGQATRTPTQVRFEREAAKKPEGAPLSNRFAEHNQQLLGKFDEFFDETGAQQPTLRAAGGVVDKAMVSKYDSANAEVRAAYSRARDAGQTAEPVPYKAISDYLNTKNAEIATDNAPMLKYVRTKLQELDPQGTGFIPVNDLEELRKGAGRLTQSGTPNAAFIGDIKRNIDSSMDQASGALYQQARRMRENVAKQFEDVGVIDKLLRTKPNSSDRVVALEDVVDHSLFGARSLDDVRQVRRVLQAGGGEQGAQAWRELQGSGINRMRDALFPENGVQDAAGNTLPRPAALKKIVADLDSDGKLEFIYGKQGATKIRDLADAAVDINYQTGVNASGTAAALEDALRQRFTGLMKLIPGGKAVAEYAESRAQSKALAKRVNASLPPPQPPVRAPTLSDLGGNP